MRGKNTIIINGRAYDAATGEPVGMAHTTQTASKEHPRSAAAINKKTPKGVISDFGPLPANHKKSTTGKPLASKPATKAKATPDRKVHTAHSVHRTPDRSHTLLRKATKRPAAYVAPVAKAEVDTAKVITKSPMISRFAPHPVVPAPKTAKTPVVAPAVVSSPKNTATPAIKSPTEINLDHPKKPTSVMHNNSKVLKEKLIKERLDEVDTQKQHKKSRGAKKMRPLHVATMCLALALFGGYMAYINMPNLSVRVASARSGVEASYPEYHPDGYSFSGPVAYAPGEVALKFASNTGSEGYTVKQRASGWDSQAVLDNYVVKESDSYLTYSEQGLTIYTYENDAAWVNGGILYTIEGDAPLSSEQILRIAASM